MPGDDSYWKLLENEGHFNTIQATIRGIAATWLLATIAALGLVLRSDPNAPVWLLARGDLMLAVLCAASLVLLLLWILDLMVYQKPLGATFVLRLYTEFRDASLPPLGAAMMAASKWRGMTPVFRYFYSVPSGVLALTGVLVAVALQVGVFGLILLNSRSSSVQLPAELQDPDFSALFSKGKADLSSVLRAYTRHAPTPPRSWPFSDMLLPARVDISAPDGSDVRVLLSLAGGGIAHFALAPGEISTAVMHKTVEEIWFVLRGAGTMWRRQEQRDELVELAPGACLTLPLGTTFQFLSLGDEPQEAVAVPMPPWPAKGEAVPVPGRWEPTVPKQAGGMVVEVIA